MVPREIGPAIGVKFNARSQANHRDGSVKFPDLLLKVSGCFRSMFTGWGLPFTFPSDDRLYRRTAGRRPNKVIVNCFAVLLNKHHLSIHPGEEK